MKNSLLKYSLRNISPINLVLGVTYIACGAPIMMFGAIAVVKGVGGLIYGIGFRKVVM